MREVGAFEAETKPGDLPAAVEEGEEVRIARLVPDRADDGRRGALAALDGGIARAARVEGGAVL